MLNPMQMMFDRAENEKSESDVAYFHGLMYAGEMMMKLVVAGLVAAVQDDRERNRYRLEYQLVRADSLGAWDKVLDNILTGCTRTHQQLCPKATVGGETRGTT